MKRAKSLARLNSRILTAFSQRTTTALRGVLPLPLHLALPHLEPVLELNVAKEVRKDTLVIVRACEHLASTSLPWEEVLPQLLDATKEVDRMFLARVGAFPVEIVIRYEVIAPIRAQRIKLLYDAVLKMRSAGSKERHLRSAMRVAFSRDEFRQLLDDLFRLYAEETRSLSHSVRLPRLLAPLRELITQELFNIMIRTARPLTLEIVAQAFDPAAPASVNESRLDT